MAMAGLFSGVFIKGVVTDKIIHAMRTIRSLGVLNADNLSICISVPCLGMGILAYLRPFEAIMPKQIQFDHDNTNRR